jgi:hypothetical protein
VAFTVEHTYGAAVYGTPVRLVGILPLGLLLAMALWLLGRHFRTGGRTALSVGGVVVAVAFVGLAGVLEGGFNHGLKLAFHLAGTPDDRLRELFDGPNFAVPDDAVFEGVGCATLVLAVPVTVHLARLLRSASTPKRSVGVGGAGLAAMTAAVAVFAVYVADPVGHVGLITLAILGMALGVGLIAVAGIARQTGSPSRIVLDVTGTLVPERSVGVAMKLSLVLKAVAVLDIVVLGAVWLIAPQTGLGEHPDARALLVARALGTDLVTIGIMNWIISRRDDAFARSFLLPNILMHVVPAAIIITLIADGTFSGADWLGAGLHVIPAVVLGWYLVSSVRHRAASLGADTRPAPSS